MRAWLAGLAPRERAAVVAGAVAVAAIVAYLAVIEPVAGAFAERERRIDALEGQLAWMRDAAAEARALRAGGARAAGSDDRPPYLVIDEALAGAGLPQPRRLEPVGDGRARLAFGAGVPFDPLVRLIGRLVSESGLRVTRARIRGTDTAGRVEAELTFARTRR